MDQVTINCTNGKYKDVCLESMKYGGEGKSIMYDDSLTDGLRNKGLNFSDFEAFLFSVELCYPMKRDGKKYITEHDHG